MENRERKRVFEEFKNLNSTGEISFQAILKQSKYKLKLIILLLTIVVHKNICSVSKIASW